MGITRGPKYPGITDGLIFTFDPKNRICWDGGWSDDTPNFSNLEENVSGSGDNMGGEEFDGAITNEGYITYDGSNAFIELETVSFMRPSEAELNATGFTVNAWVNSDSATDYQGVWCNDGVLQTTYYGLETTIGSSGDFTMHKMDGGAPATSNRLSMVSSIPVVPGVWTYVTWNYVTANNDDWIIYVNGVDRSGVRSGGGAAIVYSSNKGGIGMRQSTPFDGKLSLLQIYNRSLSQAEVLQNYKVQKSRFGL